MSQGWNKSVPRARGDEPLAKYIDSGKLIRSPRARG